jgi:integrase
MENGSAAIVQTLQRLKGRGLVFPNVLGGPLDPSVLTRNFEKLVRNVGLTNVRLHDLRYFHATLLLKAGTHPKIVQERLGHSSIMVTLDTYSHVVPGLQEKAASGFAKAMEEAQNKVAPV